MVYTVLVILHKCTLQTLNALFENIFKQNNKKILTIILQIEVDKFETYF